MNTALNTIVGLSRPSAAAALQVQLKEAEAAIDKGVINAGELIGKTIRAAEEAGIHRTAIQRMLLRLHGMQAHGLKAQWDLQIFHQQCREHLKKLNVEELGWGDTGGTPAMSQLLFAEEEATPEA